MSIQQSPIIDKFRKVWGGKLHKHGTGIKSLLSCFPSPLVPCALPLAGRRAFLWRGVLTSTTIKPDFQRHFIVAAKSCNNSPTEGIGKHVKQSGILLCSNRLCVLAWLYEDGQQPCLKTHRLAERPRPGETPNALVLAAPPNTTSTSVQFPIRGTNLCQTDVELGTWLQLQSYLRAAMLLEQPHHPKKLFFKVKRKLQSSFPPFHSGLSRYTK